MAFRDASLRVRRLNAGVSVLLLLFVRKWVAVGAFGVHLVVVEALLAGIVNCGGARGI